MSDTKLRMPRIVGNANNHEFNDSLQGLFSEEVENLGLQRVPRFFLVSGASLMTCGLLRPCVVLPEEASN
ncbi:MAG: hypothetical protein ACI9R3_001073 [Verrucomicrobiales bacterium]|jgi:hypothetical protein